jgi:hypothetical protein
MINPSAVLELESTNKGLLMPRMTSDQRDLIVSPAIGLMIFNTTQNQLQTNTGTVFVPSWTNSSSGGTVASISGTSPINSNGSTVAPVISIDIANTTTTGALSFTDYNTFNSKISTFSAGTTGLTQNTENATVTLGGTLNVSNGGTGATSAEGALTNLGAQSSNNLSTNVTTDSGSDTKYPSVNALEYYVAAQTKINITTAEVALPYKIDGQQLYAIKGSFTASGISSVVTVSLPAGITGYYKMVTYKDGKTFRREIYSFDTTINDNNVITGSAGVYSEVYPAGTYSYVLEYFK